MLKAIEPNNIYEDFTANAFIFVLLLQFIATARDKHMQSAIARLMKRFIKYC
jgi:hypothetical protein